MTPDCLRPTLLGALLLLAGCQDPMPTGGSAAIGRLVLGQTAMEVADEDPPSITEPLRLGDQVVIDGFSGRVEEIRMSFVVVRMWDERAAIVPTSRFLDNSFENWSRISEQLTGPVFLQLDPATEIAPIRAEFERFLDQQPKWDKRTGSLFVTEARAGSIEVRMAMSAATIGDLFELRAAVREHMLDWLRRHQPNALLRTAVTAAEPATA